MELCLFPDNMTLQEECYFKLEGDTYCSERNVHKCHIHDMCTLCCWNCQKQRCRIKILAKIMDLCALHIQN